MPGNPPKPPTPPNPGAAPVTPKNNQHVALTHFSILFPTHIFTSKNSEKIATKNYLLPSLAAEAPSQASQEAAHTLACLAWLSSPGVY